MLRDVETMRPAVAGALALTPRLSSCTRTRSVNPWSLWMTATVGSFVAMEARAILKRDIPTLSECLARWSGTHPRSNRGHLIPLVFLAGCGWLTVHIVTWGTGSSPD